MDIKSIICDTSYPPTGKMLMKHLSLKRVLSHNIAEGVVSDEVIDTISADWLSARRFLGIAEEKGVGEVIFQPRGRQSWTWSFSPIWFLFHPN